MARMGRKRNAYEVLAEKIEGRRPAERASSKGENGMGIN